MKTRITNREAIRLLSEMLNDYGIRQSIGMSGETAEQLDEWLVSVSATSVALSVASEQASYALRHRHGEDMETLQKTMRAIEAIKPENFA